MITRMLAITSWVRANIIQYSLRLIVITLASNFRKLFERIINNRITNQIYMVEASAGG